jgi:hypothetical protein
LGLNVERGHTDVWNLDYFVERKRDWVTVKNVAHDQFQQKLRLRLSSLVVSKLKGLLNIAYAFLFGNWFCWSLRAVFED